MLVLLEYNYLPNSFVFYSLISFIRTWRFISFSISWGLFLPHSWFEDGDTERTCGCKGSLAFQHPFPWSRHISGAKNSVSIRRGRGFILCFNFKLFAEDGKSCMNWVRFRKETVSLWGAKVVREGQEDITLIGWGTQVHVLQKAWSFIPLYKQHKIKFYCQTALLIC